MIYLLITLLISIFSSDDNDFFSIPNVNKQIKEHIAEDQRKDSVLIYMKQGKGFMKDYQKNHKKNLKRLKKSLNQETISSSEVKALFKKDTDELQQMQDSLIHYRLKIQVLINENEWKEILKPVTHPSDKYLKKKKKKQLREKEKIEELLSETKETISKIMDDGDKKQEVLIAFEEFTNEIDDLIEYDHNYSYSKNETLKNRKATKPNLEEIYAVKNKIRSEIHQSFHSFFGIAKKNTTEDEWKDLRKELKNLF